MFSKNVNLELLNQYHNVNIFMISKKSKITAIAKDQRGFTLLELVTTCAIIIVLGAIAIPQYTLYRARAFDADADITLRRVATAEEAYFMKSSNYISCNQSDCSTYFPEIRGIPLAINLQFTCSAVSCTATASHSRGTGKVYSWSS